MLHPPSKAAQVSQTPLRGIQPSQLGWLSSLDLRAWVGAQRKNGHPVAIEFVQELAIGKLEFGPVVRTLVKFYEVGWTTA